MEPLKLNDLINQTLDSFTNNKIRAIPLIEFDLCIGTNDKGELIVHPWVQTNCEASKIKFKLG